MTKLLRTSSRLWLLMLTAALGSACSDDKPSQQINSNLPDSGLDGSTAASGDGAAPSASNAEPSRCGNDKLEDEEGCDDGNRDDGDGCSRFCRDEVCGNERLDVGEECDPPVEGSCSTSCQVLGDGGAGGPSICGNGVVEAGEECDDNNSLSGDGCSALCGSEFDAICGNGTQESGEQCDDGNLIAGDGCEANCTPTVQGTPYACGNGTVDTKASDPRLREDEGCDDGNLIAGDGCSGLCTIESKCGDGNITGSEECDDPTDEYCSTLCTVVHWCGNGELTGEEECDDGNDVAHDGCTGCRIDGVCGNGLLDWDEQCDGALGIRPGGFCSATTCKRVAGPGCGNGALDAGEECDDGNLADWDGCQGNCELELCGNGDVDEGEQCDDGTTCFALPTCGDGARSANEQCDDGNSSSGDGCSSSCQAEPRHGDGVLDSGEQCDDGNVNDGDGCSASGQNEAACGNGTVEPGEQCDDGNVLNGDACSSRCRNVGSTPGGGGTPSGCTNFEFDTDSSCWSARGSDVTLAFSNQDASAASNSGSLAVTFAYPSTSSVIATAGARNCIDVSSGGAYTGTTRYLIGSSEPPSTQVMLALVEYSGAGCTGSFGTPALGYGGARGSWADLSVSVNASAAAKSVEVRLFVVRRLSEAAATALFDHFTWSAGIPGPATGCGNGTKEGAESCDDGNLSSGDGCSATCGNEPVCGDGSVNGNEDCEDGNFVNGDGCSSSCREEARCGDGSTQGVEECDDGNAVDTDACTNHCRLGAAFCGDGNVDPGEACDSGGVCDSDCTATCTLPAVCGDTDVAGAEECDDGNLENGDGCSVRCKNEVCGDGIVQENEICDDHGTSARCTDTCTLVNPTADGCRACEEKQCSAQLDACENMTGQMNEGPGIGVPRATLCDQVYACRTAYTARGDDAYCGEDCAQPDGPCKDLIERAAGTTDRLRVLEVMQDPNSINGVATALANCSTNLCGQLCLGKCGNGRVEGAEECDDVALADASVTSVPYCEDGGDTCGIYCAQGCNLAVCGDGVTTAPVEECDGQDDCDGTCHFIPGTCGDGVINTNPVDNENCETNDAISDDCNATCCRVHPTCGNGIVEVGCSDDPVEDCELGTLGCDANCHFQADSCDGCLAEKCSGPNVAYGYIGTANGPNGLETFDQLLACRNGRELYSYAKATGAPYSSLEVAQQCSAVLDCLNTPVSDGRLPIDTVEDYLPYLGLDLSPNSPEWIAVSNGKYSDATGPCKVEYFAATGGTETSNLTLTQLMFNYNYPAGIAGQIALCERDYCSSECGVKPRCDWNPDCVPVE